MNLNGPLLGLSLRHTSRHTGKGSVPRPPTNEDRRRALLAVWPMESRNSYQWPNYAREQSAPNYRYFTDNPLSDLKDGF